MTTKIRTLVAAAAAVFSFNASAQNYWGVGLNSFDFRTDEVTDFNDKARLVSGSEALEGLFGFEWMPYLAAEARLGLGFNGDKVQIETRGLSLGAGSFELSSYLSGYLRPQYQSGPFQAYALLGFSGVKFELKADDEKDAHSKRGFSYGVGASYALSATASLNLEWKQLADISFKPDQDEDEPSLKAKFTGFGISYTQKF